jgi:multicomponent K+:H+ antiporter subunit C
MELIIALLIGTLAGSGVWLLLRPRTFQVIIGLSLLSYAVNLFIFVMGWVRGGRPPFVEPGAAVDFSQFADPLPQALVLTGDRHQLRHHRAASRECCSPRAG